MSPRGSIYIENCNGRKTEPYGTPQVRWAAEDKALPIVTENVLWSRYDLNRQRASKVLR